MDATVAESSGSPDHLLVLVHGLADTKSAWDRCVVELRNMPDAGRYVFLQSAVNARWRTHHGVDVCGQRLAEEICALLATAPGLTHVSMIGHSMGGMIARYAAGLLYRPADGTIAGLTPRHFVTLASPHLGLTVDAGPAQVPFVAWAGHLPVLGGALQRGLQAIGHGVAARLFSGTGRHFLALDGGPGELPLLIRMTLDEPDKWVGTGYGSSGLWGCYFFSALRAFRTRACYGNVGRDHWVSWQNATLRDTPQLPDLDPQLVRRGRGVVVSFALGRLQQMPWRRVDVSFAGARMGTAHNNIQATRWTNTVGAGVLRHLRQHLEAMELHVAAHSPGRAA
eukprot:XP_001690773.1 predicted protein [Chlamydomonas reinhardtii]